MLAVLLRRIAQSALVLLLVGGIAFAMFRYVGDPVDGMLGQQRQHSDVVQLRHELGLDQPVWQQYARYLGRALQGDLGVSYRQGRPVGEILLERLPATVELALVSAALALTFGIGLGILTAIAPDHWGSRVILLLSLVGVSVPTFLIGITLIYVFSVGLGWLPSFGRGQTVDLGGWRTGLLTPSGRRALILPAVTLGLYQLTLILRLVRAEVRQVLRQDFITFARVRGLGPRAIYLRHALRNALMPVLTVAGLQLGAILAFAIVTETVFQWPGLGLLFVNAIQYVDIPVMAAYLMLTAVVFLTLNLGVDLLQMLLDPRARSAR